MQTYIDVPQKVITIWLLTHYDDNIFDISAGFCNFASKNWQIFMIKKRVNRPSLFYVQLPPKVLSMYRKTRIQ